MSVLHCRLPPRHNNIPPHHRIRVSVAAFSAITKAIAKPITALMAMPDLASVAAESDPLPRRSNTPLQPPLTIGDPLRRGRRLLVLLVMKNRRGVSSCSQRI